MDTIDKFAWILINNKKILSTRSKGKDVWYIPGGKREVGESDIEALEREIKEELSVDLVQNSIEFFDTYKAQAHEKPKGVFVRMTCFVADFQGELTPSSEIEEITWMDSTTNPKLLSPVDIIIFEDLKKRNLIS